MTTAAHCDEQIVRPRKIDGQNHVRGSGAAGDQGGLAVEGAIPDTTCVVVPVLTRREHLATHRARKSSMSDALRMTSLRSGPSAGTSAAASVAANRCCRGSAVAVKAAAAEAQNALLLISRLPGWSDGVLRFGSVSWSRQVEHEHLGIAPVLQGQPIDIRRLQGVARIQRRIVRFEGATRKVNIRGIVRAQARASRFRSPSKSPAYTRASW